MQYVFKQCPVQKKLERIKWQFLFLEDFQPTLKEKENGFKIYIEKIGNQLVIADCVQTILQKTALSELVMLSSFKMIPFQLVSKAFRNI